MRLNMCVPSRVRPLRVRCWGNSSESVTNLYVCDIGILYCAGTPWCSNGWKPPHYSNTPVLGGFGSKIHHYSNTPVLQGRMLRSGFCFRYSKNAVQWYQKMWCSERWNKTITVSVKSVGQLGSILLILWNPILSYIHVSLCAEYSNTVTRHSFM